MRNLVLLFIGLLIFNGCNKKEKSNQSSSTVVSSVVSNLQQIQTGFTPTSMSNGSATVQGADIKTMMSGSGPCTGLDFFQCQSVLVKLYFAIGKSLVGQTAQIVASVGNNLGQLADGATGTATDSNGGTIQYSKTSASVFSILAKNSAGASGLYLSVNDTSYSVKFDLANLDSTATDPVKLEMTISYTSASAWSVDLLMIQPTCDTNDPGAPNTIKLVLSRDTSIWTGKAMLYHPHWGAAGTATCSDSTSIGMYTDFVGSESATKGSLYLIPGATSSWTNAIDTYAFSNFCTNFASYCGSSTGQIDSGMPTNYPNPFCSTTPGVTPTFNSTCSTVDTSVANGSYSASSLWLTPSTLGTSSITLPTTL